MSSKIFSNRLKTNENYIKIDFQGFYSDEALEILEENELNIKKIIIS